MTCPRCMSQLFANRDGDGECVTCGCISYLTMRSPGSLVPYRETIRINVTGKRGRPSKADALTPAERQRNHRQKAKPS